MTEHLLMEPTIDWLLNWNFPVDAVELIPSRMSGILLTLSCWAV